MTSVKCVYELTPPPHQHKILPAMSKDYLPTHVNPIRFADNETELHGTMSLSAMSRLGDSLLSNEGNVEVTIRFGLDDQGIRFLQGQLATQLNLQCQRCMESYLFEVNSRFLSGLVTNQKDVAALPANYDPLLVTDADLNVQDMVEEELILSLPIVPMHDENECKIKLPLAASNVTKLPIAEHESPFKVIESLKTKLKKEE